MSEEEIRILNPIQTNDTTKAKVFFYDGIGMARVTMVGNSMSTSWNKHLTQKACLIGKQKRLNSQEEK